MDLHPIEAGWRRFRNGPHVDLLRKSLEARSSYLRFIHMARLPNEIILPGAVVWNLVALQEARAEMRSLEHAVPVKFLFEQTDTPELTVTLESVSDGRDFGGARFESSKRLPAQPRESRRKQSSRQSSANSPADEIELPLTPLAVRGQVSAQKL